MLEKIQHYVGSLFYVVGLTTVVVTVAIEGSFTGDASNDIVAGAALVLVGYCVQGFRWSPK